MAITSASYPPFASNPGALSDALPDRLVASVPDIYQRTDSAPTTMAEFSEVVLHSGMSPDALYLIQQQQVERAKQEAQRILFMIQKHAAYERLMQTSMN
ncbi:hypothetical protein EXS70_01125 [Candidatus Peribacteria bacterium]|nr:hypothetical protein [Candidatus Peribacteria bacterium]